MRTRRRVGRLRACREAEGKLFAFRGKGTRLHTHTLFALVRSAAPSTGNRDLQRSCASCMHSTRCCFFLASSCPRDVAAHLQKCLLRTQARTQSALAKKSGGATAATLFQCIPLPRTTTDSPSAWAQRHGLVVVAACNLADDYVTPRHKAAEDRGPTHRGRPRRARSPKWAR